MSSCNTIETVKVLNMPNNRHSGMDGKRMITNKIVKCTDSHPCDWISASMLTAHS